VSDWQKPLRKVQAGIFPSEEADKKFQEMVGAKIVAVGFHPMQQEGGLTFDFIPSGSDKTRRMVLGYTELGAWVEWCGDLE